jgi:parvulin-like peptidyl-prolyl isomerase
MSRSARFAYGLVVLVATLGCDTPNEPPPAASSSLPAGVVARVEGESISGFAVAQIAERQLLEPRAALSRALSDALFAAAGRATLPVAVTSSIERAAAARSVLEHIAVDSAAAGPPSDAEMAELLRERWADLARPDAVRTTHAVVINADTRRDAAAQALAEKIASSAKVASSAEQFTTLAKAVPTEGFEVKAEALPAITADGRGLSRTDKGFVAASTFDHEFARAANQLQQPGELSPVVKTRFGYHVIRLEERIPARVVPRAELPAVLGPEVQTRRAARQRRELLEKLRRASAVQIDRAVDELTARVQPSP